MAQFVNRAYLVVDGKTVFCEELSYKLAEDGRDIVKTMNPRNRAEGYQGGVITAELTATVPQPHGGFAVDFHKLFLDGTEFAAVIEYDDGARASFGQCRIKDPEVSSRQGEKTTLNLTIDSLDPRFS